MRPFVKMLWFEVRWLSLKCRFDIVIEFYVDFVVLPQRTDRPNFITDEV